MTDGSGSTSWSYDQRGRLRREAKTVTGSGSFLTEWAYNSADVLDWMKYPGGNGGQAGEQVNFTYHPQMLLKTATGSTTYLKGADYDAAGQPDLLNLGLNISEPYVKLDYNYYPWNVQGGRLEFIKSGTPSSPTSLQNLTYTYDVAGNVNTIVDGANSNQKQCFSYDAANRLILATTYNKSPDCTAQLGNGNYQQNYTYETNGRLHTKTGIGTYSYAYGDHLHGVASTSNGWTFAYDANGNMTDRNVGSNYDYTYDLENRLVSVSGAASASFNYDGDGKRVKGVVGGVTTTYIGDWFEWSGSTSTMKKYYYAGSQRIAMRIGSGTDTSGLKWLLGDHLGSTSVVAGGSSGARVAELRYKPWGELRYAYQPTPTDLRYTGQRAEGIGLYFYRSRWYDPLSYLYCCQPPE